MNKRRSADGTSVETLAVQALAYLADEPDRLRRFLAVSGLDAAQIRTAAAEPGFLAGVLEYVCSDEKLMLAIADHLQLDPGELARAQTALSGRQWEREIP
jgi:Protein of unknown function (DUF3572)